MRTISLEELLESGAHLGIKSHVKTPKLGNMSSKLRDGIHIIDLAKTKRGLG